MIKTILRGVATVAVGAVAAGFGYSVWPEAHASPDQWRFAPCPSLSTAICFQHERGVDLIKGSRVIMSMGHKFDQDVPFCWFVTGTKEKQGACLVAKS